MLEGGRTLNHFGAAVDAAALCTCGEHTDKRVTNTEGVSNHVKVRDHNEDPAGGRPEEGVVQGVSAISRRDSLPTPRDPSTG